MEAHPRERTNIPERVKEHPQGEETLVIHLSQSFLQEAAGRAEQYRGLAVPVWVGGAEQGGGLAVPEGVGGAGFDP